jgi:hypothetical protein
MHNKQIQTLTYLAAEVECECGQLDAAGDKVLAIQELHCTELSSHSSNFSLRACS